MKKIFLIITVLLIGSSIAFADMVVNPSALPKQATQLITEHFNGAQIIIVEQDYDSFEVKLNSGAEIDFYANGEWKEIKTYQNFPVKVLPDAVVQSVSKAHPQAFIIKAEKTWNGFEIKTSNMMEIYITPNGQIMGQKFDD